MADDILSTAALVEDDALVKDADAEPAVDNEFKLDVVSVRLRSDFQMLSSTPIRSPADAVAVFSEYVGDMDREVLAVFNLRTDGAPINCSIANMGTLESCVTHPRELMKSSILSNAASIVLCHNHVSGSMEPSAEDIKLTDRMTKVCNLVGVKLLDHIIISGGNTSRHCSMLEMGIMEKSANGDMIVKSEYLPSGQKVAERGTDYGKTVYRR